MPGYLSFLVFICFSLSAGDHAVIDLKNIRGFQPRQVTVRTKSRDLVSADSLPCLIPHATNGKVGLRTANAQLLNQNSRKCPSEIMVMYQWSTSMRPHLGRL